MTPAERVAELIQEGGTIQLNEPVGLSLTLAGALWLTGPRRLRWCAIFPEHQGHVHETRYSRAVLANDGRDVVFYRGDELIGSVVPYVEGELDPDAVRKAVADWQALLQKHDNQARFARFLEEA